MNIIQRLWWSLGRGNPVVPSRWQATPSIAWQDEAGVDAQPILKAAREHP